MTEEIILTNGDQVTLKSIVTRKVARIIQNKILGDMEFKRDNDGKMTPSKFDIVKNNESNEFAVMQLIDVVLRNGVKIEADQAFIDELPSEDFDTLKRHCDILTNPKPADEKKD